MAQIVDAEHEDETPTSAYIAFYNDVRMVLQFDTFIVKAALAAREKGMSEDPLDELGRFKNLQGQLMTQRIVDSALVYVTSLLTLIFNKRPEPLQRFSEKEVKVADVLRWATKEELVHDIIDKRVMELSYQGVRQLNDTLKRVLALPLVTNDEDLLFLVEMVELRNIVTHNRGIINRAYCDRMKVDYGRVGETINHAWVTENAQLMNLFRIIADLDTRAIEKFTLVEKRQSDS